jgi:hypothetical protein
MVRFTTLAAPDKASRPVSRCADCAGAKVIVFPLPSSVTPLGSWMGWLIVQSAHKIRRLPFFLNRHSLGEKSFLHFFFLFLRFLATPGSGTSPARPETSPPAAKPIRRRVQT